MHEGEELDEAELVLHELAHQTLLPSAFVFTPGRMKDANEVIGNYLDKLATWRQDLHEIRAIAIELNVARQIGLKLRFMGIIQNSQINTHLFKTWGVLDKDYARLIARARKTVGAQIRAGIIVTLLESTQKEGT